MPTIELPGSGTDAPTVAQVRAADTGALEHGIALLQSFLIRLQDTQAAFKNNVVNTVTQPDIWSGPAAGNAGASLSTTYQEYTATCENLAELIELLQTGAAGYRSAQAYLAMARDLAAANGLIIGEDWSVATASAGARPNAAARRDVAELLDLAQSATMQVEGSVVGAIESQDLSWTDRSFLAAAAAGAQSAATIDAQVTIASLPPANFSSAQVNQWWSSLSAADQQFLIRSQPARIGSLDGLPATARDEANRIVLSDDVSADQTQLDALREQEAQAEAELAELRRTHGAFVDAGRAGELPSPAYLALDDKLASLEGRISATSEQLTALTSLQGKLDMGGQPYEFEGREVTMPPMYLLGFDTNEAGHAIVACGDPDTAKNVAVYVPGLNTSSNSAHFQFDVQHTQNMTLAADGDAGANDTATILWLGYNAPQMTAGPSALAVSQTDDATAAVPALTGFLSSLRTTDKDISNLTLLGHSYGSVVVGETARASRLPVDNIILVGSPGVEAGSAAQLNIAPSHVWTGTAPNDPVARLGWFGGPPTDPGFGANQFTVNATGGSGLMGQHGEYFDDATSNLNGDRGDSSLNNIGYIISGQTNKVQLVHSALPLPPRTDPLPAPGMTTASPTTPTTPDPVRQASPEPPAH